MGVREVSRIGLGTYQLTGANGFTSRDLLTILQAATPAFGGADLPGATALDSGSAWRGTLGTDTPILTGIDIDVIAGAVYYEQNGVAADATKKQIRVGEPLGIHETTIALLKKLRFFSPAGQNFDIRIQLWG